MTQVFNAVNAVVTDIEGTTTSISFVHENLFPYARKHMREFLLANAETAAVAAELAAVNDAEEKKLTVEQAADVLIQWIDEDRKTTPLKALQGMIWRMGYERGDLQGHVYDDVSSNLEQWRALGKKLYVYSSGSVEAQKLIFGHSSAGNLAPLFSGYFDTRTGAKRDPASYDAISTAIFEQPKNILFLSDIGAELDAARNAGMQTLQLMRDETAQRAPHHPAVNSFNEIDLAPH